MSVRWFCWLKWSYSVMAGASVLASNVALDSHGDVDLPRWFAANPLPYEAPPFSTISAILRVRSWLVAGLWWYTGWKYHYQLCSSLHNNTVSVARFVDYRSTTILGTPLTACDCHGCCLVLGWLGCAHSRASDELHAKGTALCSLHYSSLCRSATGISFAWEEPASCLLTGAGLELLCGDCCLCHTSATHPKQVNDCLLLFYRSVVRLCNCFLLGSDSWTFSSLPSIDRRWDMRKPPIWCWNRKIVSNEVTVGLADFLRIATGPTAHAKMDDDASCDRRLHFGAV